MTTQCIFPTELVCEILSYTSPLDLVRWRTGSKWFCIIAHDPQIWKASYANARFLRPPGPFPTVNFERAFVQSARLAQSWTTQCPRTVSCASVPFDGSITSDRYLVGGRWLVVCQSDRRFVLYDTNANAVTCAPQVLWEQEEEIMDWDMCPMTSEEGHCVVYMLLDTDSEDPPRWTLLEFLLNAESGALYDTVTLDVPILDVARHLELDGGQKLFSRSPFLTIPSQCLAFDTRTRVFYEFPNLYGSLDTTRSWLFDPKKGYVFQIVPTNTHVIFIREGMEPCIVVQAFTVPDHQHPAENGRGSLRLSHEGIFPRDKAVFAVLRNSVVDPITGAISVKLLGRHSKYYGFQAITYINLTLDKPSPDDVSPITIGQQPVLSTGNVPTYDHLGFCHEYYDISDDGYARGLFTHCALGSNSCGAVKFTIDATQDHCVAVLSPYSDRERDLILFPTCPLYDGVSLDGVRGRLSYVDRNPDGRQAVVVVDIE